jgi:hypothetical protein
MHKAIGADLELAPHCGLPSWCGSFAWFGQSVKTWKYKNDARGQRVGDNYIKHDGTIIYNRKSGACRARASLVFGNRFRRVVKLAEGKYRERRLSVEAWARRRPTLDSDSPPSYISAACLEGAFIEPTQAKPGLTSEVDVTPLRGGRRNPRGSHQECTRASINPLPARLWVGATLVVSTLFC